MTTLRQQMQRDLEFLKQAFPHLQEQFPDGEWVFSIDEDFYKIFFRCGISRPNKTGGYLVDVRILVIGYEPAKRSQKYTAYLPDGTFLGFPTIYAAAEFIGRISHALTPINQSAAALEARFGGAND